MTLWTKEAEPSRPLIVCTTPRPHFIGAPLTLNTAIAHTADDLCNNQDILLASPLNPEAPRSPFILQAAYADSHRANVLYSHSYIHIDTYIQLVYVLLSEKQDVKAECWKCYATMLGRVDYCSCYCPSLAVF